MAGDSAKDRTSLQAIISRNTQQRRLYVYLYRAQRLILDYNAIPRLFPPTPLYSHLLHKILTFPVQSSSFRDLLIIEAANGEKIQQKAYDAIRLNSHDRHILQQAVTSVLFEIITLIYPFLCIPSPLCERLSRNSSLVP